MILGFAFLAASPAASASAATGVQALYGEPGTLGGQFAANIGGIAINQAGTGGAGAGDVYVVDGGNNRVQQFTASGEFIRAFGADVGGPGVDVCAAAATCVQAAASEEAGGMSRPEGVAVDQGTGTVFVSDYGNRRVDVFSATGVFQGAFGWNVDASAPAEELQFCTAASGCQAGSEGAAAGQFAQERNALTIGGVAISPLNGHILVASTQNRRVDEFSPAFTGGAVTGVSFVRGFGWGAVNGADEFQICSTTCHAPDGLGDSLGQFGLRSPGGLAVDATGRAIVPDSNPFIPGPETARVMTFDPAGSPVGFFALSAWASGGVPRPGIAVKVATGNVLIPKGNEGGILEFDPSGNQVEAYLQGAGFSGLNSAIAVDEASDTIYVTDRADRGFVTLGPIVPPTASLKPVTKFDLGPTGVSATFEGHVDPEGLKTGYHFEYSRDGANWTRVPATDLFLPSDSVEHEVEQTATGLEGSSDYRVRLVAAKIFNSGSASAEITFRTPAAPPIVSAPSVSASDTSAVLTATVNPENEPTRYRFECVTEAQFQQSGFFQAFRVPSGPEPTVEGGGPVEVSQTATGLAPVTAYRCRIVAANGAGQTVGAASAFTTFQPGFPGLPDTRAYEQVSPVDKNGNNARGEADAVQAAADGGRITFFVNGGIPGGRGSQDFPTYLASRSPDGSGWTTQGLLPPAATGPFPYAKLLGWDENLLTAYDSNRVPGGNPTFYRRDNGTGALTAIAAAKTEQKQAFTLAATSADASKVLFETDADQLTPNAAAGTSNVYLWDKASGDLVLASVMNNRKAPNDGAFAGPYEWFAEHGVTTAAGGATKLYYTQAQHALAADGTAVFFTEKGTGQLYVRKNPLARQSNVPGGECTQPERACTIQISAPEKGVVDPNGEQPAAFLGATPDGLHAFFLSSGKLTADATTGPTDAGVDLYRYDVEGGELTDLTVDPDHPNGAEVRGVVAISDDGSYVYFVANGSLAAGAVDGSCIGSATAGEGEGVRGVCNLYLWHGGTITFIAPMDAVATEAKETDIVNWAPTARRLGGQVREATGRASADGRTILFRSKGRLTSYDNNGVNQLYRYQVGQGLQCVSCNPSGAPPTGNASLQTFPSALLGPRVQHGILTRNLSANGNRVFFNTPDKLVATDTNGVSDVYEWEANGEGSCRSTAENGGCLYLLSTGKSPEPSFFADASLDGSDAFFFTSQPLVGQDRDQLVDVYDARVGGGIAAQYPVESNCGEGGCKSSPAAAPAGKAPAPPVGGGNVKPKPHCRKGFRRVTRHDKSRCARVKHRHHRRHHHKGKHRHHKGKRAGKGGKHHNGKKAGRGGKHPHHKGNKARNGANGTAARGGGRGL